MEAKLVNRFHAIVELCFRFRMRLFQKFSIKQLQDYLYFYQAHSSIELKARKSRNNVAIAIIFSYGAVRKIFVKPSSNNISMKPIHILEENSSRYKNRWKRKKPILRRKIDSRSVAVTLQPFLGIVSVLKPFLSEEGMMCEKTSLSGCP